MTYGVALVERQFSVLVYDGASPNYIASAMVSVYGDRGWLWQINGAGFYRAAPEIWEAIIGHGVASLEGYVTPPHARLLRAVLKGRATVEIDDPKAVPQFGGHAMVWFRAAPLAAG